MSKRLDKKVCIITGVGGAMGRAASIMFAREGAKIVGCDIDVNSAQETVDAVRSLGGDMLSVHPCDIGETGEIERVISVALEAYGRIDVLYNNGGAAQFEWMESHSDSAWNFTIKNELDIVFKACKAVWPHFIKGGGGSIINVGSVSGKLAYEVLPGVAHCAAKGGVIAMTKQLAMEGGQHNIRANSISPGLVMNNVTRELMKDSSWSSPMIKKLMLGRVGEPEDIVPCAIYLGSDESSWVTGADFAIDGGTTAW